MQYVTTVNGLRAVYRSIQQSSHVAYDLETTGVEPLEHNILLLQFCGNDGAVYVVNPRQIPRSAIQATLTALSYKVVLAHNAKFEYTFTKYHYGVALPRLYDSMLAEALLTAGRDYEPTDLGATVQRRLGVTLDKDLQTSFVGAELATFEPSAEQIAYAGSDVALLHELRTVQCQALKAEGLLRVAALEFQALPAFAEMELAGMRLDLDEHAAVLAKYQVDAEHYGMIAASTLDPYWQTVATRRYEADTQAYQDYTAQITEALQPYGGRLNKDVPADVAELVKDLRSARQKCKPVAPAPISLTSRDQVLAALAESGVSLDNLQKETVTEYKHKSPTLAAYADYVKAQKIVSTYGDSLRAKVNAKTGRVHPHYTQIVSTGRTSSSNPNGQNMPKAIRQCFKPEAGNVFIVADFANMELRIAAGLSSDPTMLDAFATGKDLHQMTAAAAWPDKYASWQGVPKDSKDRASAKTANFASIYGGSAEALYHRGLIDDLPTAKAVVDGIAKAYPVLWNWIHTTGEQAVHDGYALTATGRKRYFLHLPPAPRGFAALRGWRKVRSRIVRQAMNHPVQGTGADIAKRAMTLIHQQGGRIVGMVHDEIIVEAPAEQSEAVKTLVADSMVQAGAEIVPNVAIPADVHVVERWEK